MNSTSSYIYVHSGIQTRIMAMADGIFHITRTRRENFLNAESPVVICTPSCEGYLREDDACAVLTAGNMEAHVNKSSGVITFRAASGEIILREPARCPCLLEEKPVYIHHYDNDSQVTTHSSVDGARATATSSEVVLDRNAYECRQNFVFDKTEGIYGLGSHEEGYGNLRGKDQLLYQHNMKAVVPVLVSTKGYGLLFDMGCMMAFRDEPTGAHMWADCADELDWYFFYGNGSYASLMEKYRFLTGPAPMLPKYALGYIQSKERYVDAEEMIAVADEYRRRNVPLDMIVLDWQSWPEGQWGWKKFGRTRFPDPSAFISRLHEKDVKFMISIWPSMQGQNNENRKEMLENGFMLGNRLIYNAFDPKARELYWKQANDELFIHGVDAWWCDCTEPFESDWKGSIKPEPFRRAQLNTDEAKRYIDPAQINLFSLYHSMGIHDGQKAANHEKRVCNLTRSSYAGQHRYATVTWSGDVSANWETLRRHIPEGMNFCVTGEPYWSTDIGAFFPNGNWDPWFYEGDFDGGVNDLGYRELFVRWAQYAAFLPMMRAHGTGTPREIWRFGEKGEMFYDAIENAIRLRYRLVPYMYSLMAETNRRGISMLRVPALVFPGDENMRRVDDQMMLGNFIMVKPVTRPMYYMPESAPIADSDMTERVTLPAGYKWHDLNTGNCHEGGQTISVEAPLGVIPTFVRAGAIIPWGGNVQHTKELAAAPIDLTVYPGADGVFTLYDDSGDGYGYENGQFTTIDLDWNDAEGILTIGDREGTFPGMPENITLNVSIFGNKPQTVIYNGSQIKINLR